MTDQADTDNVTEEQEPSTEPIADQPTVSDDSAAANDATADENGTAGERSTAERVVGALQWAAFAILILVALIATLRFYFAASNAINEFVTRQYRPLFQAGFNLVILLASILGISVLVRRIT